jgi:hypothetical protein
VTKTKRGLQRVRPSLGRATTFPIPEDPFPGADPSNPDQCKQGFAPAPRGRGLKTTWKKTRWTGWKIGRFGPADGKYKTYDANKISTSDIYQTFLYAYALCEDGSERRAGIMFPSSGTTAPGPCLSIKSPDGSTATRIVASGIHVPAALEALANNERGALFASIRAAVWNITALDATPTMLVSLGAPTQRPG